MNRTSQYIYYFCPSLNGDHPKVHWCSISDVLFTDGRGVSDFSVLQYY